MKNEIEENLTVSFKVELAQNGDLQRIHLIKDNQKISLTLEQAKSLAEEILRRV